MFGQGGGPFGAEAVQKESFRKGVPKAFPQAGGKKSFAPFKKGKKKPMRFGNEPKVEGLDMKAIMGGE